MTEKKGYKKGEGSSTSGADPSASIPTEAYPISDAPPPHSPPLQTGAGVPTVDAPFNFPPADELPEYEPPTSPSASEANLKPIAIPQIQPTASSPFLQAYAPCLLAKGVTESTWRSFLDTISAFLTAKVGDRAVSHAGDMAKHFSEGPKNLGKGVMKHAKSVGKDLTRHAKKGNVFGVAVSAVTGIVSIPIFTALGIAGTAVSLPGVALAAITRSPKTPAERVTAYAAVANQKWLHLRGLHAQLVDTKLLAHMLGVPVQQFLDIAKSGKGDGAAAQMKALEAHVEALDVQGEMAIELSEKSMWLVIAQEVREEDTSKE